jgi:hypothetical protein
MRRQDYIEALEGKEIWSVHFATLVVLQKDGKFHTYEGRSWRPDMADLKQLFDDAVRQEYGTTYLPTIMKMEGFDNVAIAHR